MSCSPVISTMHEAQVVPGTDIKVGTPVLQKGTSGGDAATPSDLTERQREICANGGSRDGRGEARKNNSDLHDGFTKWSVMLKQLVNLVVRAEVTCCPTGGRLPGTYDFFYTPQLYTIPGKTRSSHEPCCWTLSIALGVVPHAQTQI